jgi:uncharacterized protein (DUF58 family)
VRRPSLRPTTAGWAFAALLAALFLAAANYGNNQVFLLVFLLAATAALSLWPSWRNLRGLAIRNGEPAPVFAGETAWLPLTLSGGDNPCHGLRIAADGGAQDIALPAPQSPVQIAGNVLHLRVPLPCPRRGWRSAGTLRLYSRYPFGLLEARLDYACPARVLVWPAPAARAPVPATACGEASDALGELRGWREGESLRRIAWKIWARSDQLLARDFESVQGSHAAILVWAALAGDAESRLALLARQVLDAEASGGDYALVLPTLRLSGGRGEGQLHACLRALALHGNAETAA